MKRSVPQAKRTTGFYDEYVRKKKETPVKQDLNILSEAHHRVIEIKQPPTIKTYGHIALFISNILHVLKYAFISVVISLLLTITVNTDARNAIVELLKNIFIGG